MVIDDTGQNLGILPVPQALKLAQAKELDLLCVSPNAKVPVCRIVNYSKWKYQQLKQKKAAKKNQRDIEIKQIRLTVRINQHDLNVKIRKMIDFLQAGNWVYVTLRFRRYEMQNLQLGYDVFQTIIETVKEHGQPIKPPELTRQILSMQLVTKNTKKAK